MSAKRHRATVARAKGYQATGYRQAKEQLLKSGVYAYRDRKARKRDFRRLWVTRINAAARRHGSTYAALMHGLKSRGIELNRPMLADIAVRDPETFALLVRSSQTAG